MDPNAQPAWKQPHTPISEAEMTHPEPHNGGRNLLTLASLLVLVGIIGITIYLYLQNRSAQNTQLAQDTTAQHENTNASSSVSNEVLSAEHREKMEKYGVVCELFTDLDEALEKKEVACGLDLSGQNLTSIPDEVYDLENLAELNISNNDFTSLPKELFEMKKLLSIDASNNSISKLDLLPFDSSLQQIDLSGNDISEADKKSLSSGKTKVTF